MDLAMLDRADPLFLKKVLESCRLLAGSPRRLAQLKIYAFKRLERMIGRMIDVNYHLLTESGEPSPREYYQSFVDLGWLHSSS